jgi:ectoine hydroxylase-related dioxygenase (phytanoyl-CoA dioxygenase family)
MLDDSTTEYFAEHGYCVIRDVLSVTEVNDARRALNRAIAQSERSGIPTHDNRLDPNASNIRVYNLPGQDACFRELMRWPQALAAVEALLGPAFLLSNFTANIALPGSGPMRLHSDQSLVVPQPWLAPWAMNVIWCLDDVHAANGATRYLPGSHLYRAFSEVPANAAELLVPFEAPAGSIIAMDGRMWHTSGANVTTDETRRMLFGYYSIDFIRPQVNWEAALSSALKAELDDEQRTLLGLGVAANTRIGAELTRLT